MTHPNIIALVLVLSLLLIPIFSSADILRNPNFETPPTNITTTTDNSTTTTPFLLLTKFNTIPGWSFNGTVRYVTAGPNVSLSGYKGHAIQLGKGAKINQTFKVGKDVFFYSLTFSLAQGSNECFNKSIAVNVSVPGRSKVFSLQRRYGKETWESHAFVVPSYEGRPINIVVRSASLDSDTTCGPIVDTFILRRRDNSPYRYGDNLLSNAEFEDGPEFVKNSTEGILLSDESDDTESILQQWFVIGTIKYVNSKLKPNFQTYVKQKAAIELVSGNSGILKKVYFEAGSKYNLEFMMGDANNSCVGEFIVHVQIDNNDIQNFTMLSNGTGSYRNCSMTTYKAKNTGLTTLTFLSFNQSETSDHVLCGPVIDNVLLRSDGLALNPHNAVMFICMFLITAILRFFG